AGTCDIDRYLNFVSTLLYLSLLILQPRPSLISTLFPYTTLFRSDPEEDPRHVRVREGAGGDRQLHRGRLGGARDVVVDLLRHLRSEEHTSELQSRFDLVCRLLLEKKKAEPSSTAAAADRLQPSLV